MLRSMIFLCVCVELLITCHIRGPKPPRHVPPPKKNPKKSKNSQHTKQKHPLPPKKTPNVTLVPSSFHTPSFS